MAIAICAVALLAQPYVLGPGDQVLIRAADVEEFTDKPFRIDESGNLTLPLVGRLHAAGLSTAQLEGAVLERLRKYVLAPSVSISVGDMRSQPVSVFGSVKNPGIVQLQGSKTLTEVLSMAGGLQPEAGYRIKITRQAAAGPIPLPDSRKDTSGRYYSAEVSVKSLMEATNPVENIAILPNDVISVPRAELIYVIGEVKKSGGFALADNERVSVLQALAMAEGTLGTAALQKASIKRLVPGRDKREDIPVDLSKVLHSKSADLQLQANDILIVPGSAAKRATTRALESILQIGTGIAVYRR